MAEITQPIGVRHISTRARVSASPLAFIPFVALVLVLFALPLSVIVFEATFAGRIFPGVQVWGVDLGGMRPEEAVLALEAHFPYSSQPMVTLRDGERIWSVRPRELGIQLDAAAVAQSAYRLGRSGTTQENLQTQARLVWSGTQLGPVVRIDPDATRRYLESLASSVNVVPRDASLRLDGMNVVATPAIVGRTLDVDAAAARLAEASRTLAPVELPLQFNVVPPTVADVSEAKAHLEAIIGSPMTIVPDASIADKVGPLQISREELASMAIIRNSEAQHVDVTLDEARLRELLAPLAPQIEQPAIDARFVFNDELRSLDVISPSQPGLALNLPATTARITQQAVTGNRQVTMVLTHTQATYNDQMTAQELGITELVAEGVTYFLGSAPSRVKNIATAAGRFHGIIVAPGEVFSFAQYLGDVSLDQGYAEALIIFNGRTITGVGGGVCQVSTTAFRAAFLGGFPIVERWPHAYRVGWYERGFGPGLDATVFAPEVDFKFKNDTPYHLLIETYVSERQGTLTFKFYSTKDGRTVKIDGPVVAHVVPHGPDIYEEDPTLQPGQKEQVDWAVDGADVTVKRLVERDGQVLSDDTIFTRYEPWQAVYKVAPGEAPPQPEPAPAP
jgi:vancomycin resistance protein YoaR